MQRTSYYNKEEGFALILMSSDAHGTFGKLGDANHKISIRLLPQKIKKESTSYSFFDYHDDY